jgi:outer membrane protein
MKKYLLIAVAALMLSSIPRVAHAQAKATAVAHINIDSLLDIMPAFKKASDSAQAFYNQLEQTMYTMQLEYQRKLNEYDSLNTHWSPPIKSLKESELNDLQGRIQKFQQDAQDSYTDYRTKLLTPIFKQIQDAVKAVAIAQGYKYVLDSSKSATVVLYAADSDDIFNAVRLKLGIPAPTPKPAPAPGGAPVPPGGH